MQKEIQMQKQNTSNPTNSDQLEPLIIEMNKSGFTIQIQQNAKIKHLFQELLTNKTLIEGDYQGPALIGGNHTW